MDSSIEPARNRIGMLIGILAQLGTVFVFCFLFANSRTSGLSSVVLAGFILSIVSTLAFALFAWRAICIERHRNQLIATAVAEAQRTEEFLHKIAHDLRNSLSSVLTGSEVLLTVYESKEAKPILESIGRQANMIAGIADRLMEERRPDLMERFVDSSDERTRPINKVCQESPLRILAIDDRRDVLLPLRVLLTKAGHEFAEAQDGATGLEKVESFRPEIVLCDIDLPGELTGMDVARKIRDQRGLESTYLVAISGNSQSSDMEASAKAGFDYRIAKPVTVEALRNLIANRPKFATQDQQRSL